MKRKSLLFVFFLLIFCLFLSGSAFAASLSNAEFNELPALEQVKYLVKNYYIFDYDESILSYDDPQAIADALDDVYTFYVSADEMAQMESRVTGESVGLGLLVKFDEQGLLSISELYEGAAKEAGLKVGDVFISVNEVMLPGKSMDEQLALLGGQAGDVKRLVMERNGSRFSCNVTLKTFYIPTVFYNMYGPVGYIAISQFRNATGRDFAAVMDILEEAGMTGLILDLRNCPGGLLSSSLEVVGELVAEGTPVIYTVYKNGSVISYNASAGGAEPNTTVPMAVLVNSSSASGAEFVAASLYDSGRAIVLGEESFGKGIMQNLVKLSDGSGFYLTVAEFFSGGWQKIHQHGVLLSHEYDTMAEAVGAAFAYAAGVPYIEIWPGSEYLHLNYRSRPMGTAPQMVNGSIYVPLRGVSEALGAKVDYSGKQVSMALGEKRVRMDLSSGVVSNGERNGKTALLVKNGYTLLPVRFFEEWLDCSVFWDAQAHKVELIGN